MRASFTEFSKVGHQKKNKKGGVENLNKNVAWYSTRRKNKILFLAVKYG